MKASVLFASTAFVASVAAGSSGHATHQRRHAPALKRAELNKRRMASEPAAPVLVRRKDPMTDQDTTTRPDNVMDGSDQDGCTTWHTVSAGEICLGLIESSSEGFDINKFFSMNPAVDDNCYNLKVGKAYCVDDAAVNGQQSAAPSSPSGDAQAQDQGGDDDEDCEDEGGDDSGDWSGNDEQASSDNGNQQQWQNNAQQQQQQSTQQQQQQQQSTQQPAPAPSEEAQSPAPQPQPSSEEPAPAPSPEPSQDSGDDGSNNGGGNQGGGGTPGEVTFYFQKGNAGACGDYNSDSAMIAAVHPDLYQDGNACGNTINITNDDGTAISVTVADLCPTCEDANHIDLATGAYDQLGTRSEGMVSVTYSMS